MFSEDLRYRYSGIRHITRKVIEVRRSRFNLPFVQSMDLRVAAAHRLCAECFTPLAVDCAFSFHPACAPAGVLLLTRKEN